MILPPGFTGAAFGTAADGDLRRDRVSRQRTAAELGIPGAWAYLNQVHGSTLLEADRPGLLGDGDAIVTYLPRIPIMVATADCVPVILEADGAVAVVHAGWRGARAGVLSAALSAMIGSGHPIVRAAIGPAIGTCCYEVGPEVVAEFPGHIGTTTWGTPSVDLPGFLRGQLDGIDDIWQSGECTYTSPQMNSWRRDKTEQRQVTVAWLPGG